MLEISLHGQVEAPSPATEDPRDRGPQNLEFASPYRATIPEGVLCPPNHSSAPPNPCPPTPCIPPHGGHICLFLDMGWEPDPLTPALALSGWAERRKAKSMKERFLDQLPRPTTTGRSPPTPAPVPVLTHPQGYQGLREVAPSETIITDFIIHLSSPRTNSSIQHANLLFDFQTSNQLSNTLWGTH